MILSVRTKNLGIELESDIENLAFGANAQDHREFLITQTQNITL